MPFSKEMKKGEFQYPGESYFKTMNSSKVDEEDSQSSDDMPKLSETDYFNIFDAAL